MKNKDEKLYNSLSRLSLSIPGDSLNIYFTYKKIKKGCFIDITENVSKKLEYIYVLEQTV